MFGKYVVFTIISSIVFSVYLYQFHSTIFDEGSLKVTEIQDTFLSWANTLIERSGADKEEEQQETKLFTVNELKKYNGEVGSKGLYLAILGKVYDVGVGEKHYGPGKSYHFFTGRDGSRAFVTGDFTEEGLKDDVLSLTAKEVKSIVDWGDFYEKDYKYVGLLVGRYYDSNGMKTEYHYQVEERIEEANTDEENENKAKLLFPPCNSEWSEETGGRVWCSKMSGGIERNWVGVPRQLYEPGSESYRCACINFDNPEHTDVNLAQIKEYPECDLTANSCKVFDDEEEEEEEEVEEHEEEEEELQQDEEEEEEEGGEDEEGEEEEEEEEEEQDKVGEENQKR